MITQENLKKQYNLIKVSFGLKFASKNEEEAYLTILFKVLTKYRLTDKNISEGTEKLIMNVKKNQFKDFFNLKEFGEHPAPADFAEYFGAKIKKVLKIEDIARIECQKIIDGEKNFDNEITKKVFSYIGGNKGFYYFKWFKISNYEEKEKFFYRKSLIDLWLDYHAMGDVKGIEESKLSINN